eukprot:scaffold1132_cov57-Cylindrotheca_fusiformis.AAC.2
MKLWTRPLYASSLLLAAPFKRTLVVVQSFNMDHYCPSISSSSSIHSHDGRRSIFGSNNKNNNNNNNKNGHPLTLQHLSSMSNAGTGPSFKPGSKVQVEVISFGPLGASVEVLGLSHDSNAILPEGEEPYATGLIYQKEIAYFRAGRDNVDVVIGEILPAYVQKVREEDGKLDIGLRAFGGKQKSMEVSEMIMEKLESSWNENDGLLPVGDKSPPEDINREFPGVSKTAFKRAVGALYKKGLIKPSPTSIRLVSPPSSSSEEAEE